MLERVVAIFIALRALDKQVASTQRQIQDCDIRSVKYEAEARISGHEASQHQKARGNRDSQLRREQATKVRLQKGLDRLMEEVNALEDELEGLLLRLPNETTSELQPKD